VSSAPPRSITPYAPFDTPTDAAPAPSSRPPSRSFKQEIDDELSRIEQSITENVKRALQALGTIVIEKQAETLREISRANARLDAHARELAILREALENPHTTIPPPPDGL
jgi:hypothetical protein